MPVPEKRDERSDSNNSAASASPMAIGDAEAALLFESERSSRFSGTGMINVDFTTQTANVREIDLRDNDMHSLRGSMAFQISNRTNSFLNENTTMMLRLDQQSENS